MIVKTLKKHGDRVEIFIKQYFDTLSMSDSLKEATLYSLMAGGKRIRPALVIEVAKSFGVAEEEAIPAAVAIEMIHTASLIHDDMPAMDNDDFRRGKPTNHVVFGEGVALLAGETLFMLPFQLLSTYYEGEMARRLIEVLSRGAGPEGMMDGQMLDLFYEKKEINYEILKKIHSLKTGALLRSAIEMGCILGDVDPLVMEDYREFAKFMGLVFQITDDILDVTGDFNTLGKPIGSDEKNEKTTYPKLFGIEESRTMAKIYGEECHKILMCYEEKQIAFLKDLILFMLQREH